MCLKLSLQHSERETWEKHEQTVRVIYKGKRLPTEV